MGHSIKAIGAMATDFFILECSSRPAAVVIQWCWNFPWSSAMKSTPFTVAFVSKALKLRKLASIWRSRRQLCFNLLDFVAICGASQAAWRHIYWDSLRLSAFLRLIFEKPENAMNGRRRARGASDMDAIRQPPMRMR